MTSTFPFHRPRSAALRIAILSEITLLRESLGQVLKETESISVCGLFSDLSAALFEILEKQPDIVLLDEMFPHARAAVRSLHEAASQTQVVVMSVAEAAEEIIAWAEAGVAGYIPRSAGVAELIPLLEGIRKGEQACTPQVGGALLRRVSLGGSDEAGGPRQTSLSSLTAREKQIVQLIAAGMSNKEIARSLNIGVATTKTHVHHLLAKMNLRRRGQAAKYVGDDCAASNRSFNSSRL